MTLNAKTARAASEISFEPAPGTERMPQCLNFLDSSCKVEYDVAPCGCCDSRSLCPEDGCKSDNPQDVETLKQHRCRFRTPTPTVDDVGLSHVRCFVAKASFCAQVGRESEEDCESRNYCYSTPVCIRFHFKGHSPAFIAPTPLQENAFDDNGQIIKGHTDIGACVGHPTPFPLAARDVDEGDQVRIVVDDRERSTSFFFAQLDFEESQSASCGKFEAYGARRSGNNAYQFSMLHLKNAEFDSSIVAPINGDIEWAVSEAHQSVDYTLNPDLNNGIFIRSECSTTQMCRQRLLNADRTLCGYALDNSRGRYRRWMGGRTLSHNLGSYSSPRHCWRIRLQAPPYFVTNSTGCVVQFGDVVRSSCTPFAPEEHATRDPTDNPAAYAKIRMPYTAKLDVSFIAFDPNPQDRVSLYVIEDPGVPDGMKVGRVECLPRSVGMPESEQQISDLLSEGECLQSCANNELDESNVPRCECKVTSAQQANAGQFCPTDLSCNRAKMRLQWQPRVEHAGSEFKVCVAARDDSQLCHGVSPTATANGWYGERQCMMIKVIQVAFLWQGPWIENLYNLTTPHPVYVGCTLSFDVAVLETTEGVSYGLRVDRAESAQEIAAEKSMVFVDLSMATDSTAVSVTPVLGSEGSTLQMCFKAGDKYGGLTFAGMCTDDDYKACSHDAHCAVGKCAMACILVEVSARREFERFVA